MGARTFAVNRAPVLTLWSAVVAERLGYDRDSALSLGKAVAGLTAQSKGRTLGIYGRSKASESSREHETVHGPEELSISLCGRHVPVEKTNQGIRAKIKDQTVDPKPVQAYLEKAFGNSLGDVREAMEELARANEPIELERTAFALYEKFRPSVAAGVSGWGQKGELDIELIRSLAPGSGR